MNCHRFFRKVWCEYASITSVNQHFNEWKLSACQFNMYTKSIWCGDNPKTSVYYMNDYVTKSALAFHEIFAVAQTGE